jgi:hypothetical protein
MRERRGEVCGIRNEKNSKKKFVFTPWTMCILLKSVYGAKFWQRNARGIAKS